MAAALRVGASALGAFALKLLPDSGGCVGSREGRGSGADPWSAIPHTSLSEATLASKREARRELVRVPCVGG